MQQLTQELKSGHMEILEVPFPALGKGQILVRNHYSVISAGTEGKTVTDARKGYIAKARSRQKEVRQVLDMIRTQGFKQTYQTVMNKLEMPSSLGYSSAGEVIAIGEGVENFKAGDKVACGGASAVHADVVSVPVHLCVKVPESIHLKYAAFSTIASIAIQGIRQADLRVGECCVIIGLGLIGQITIQVLKAAGIKTIGIDISDIQVQAALNNGADMALNRDQNGLEKIIYDATRGYGADAVIITAGTSSLDPVDLAGELLRKKGKVVIVGAVPTGFSRDKYYRKELDLRMSSSYGPGRYDLNYEEKGIDYPVGYVRWTENRNMQSFIDLLESQKISVENLITHTFPLEEAPEAYRLIVDKSEPFLGILIQYEPDKEIKEKIQLMEIKMQSAEPCVGFIGAGSFAQNMLIPNIKDICHLIGVTTTRGNTSRYVADKYKFNYCTNKPEDLLNDKNINTLFIATRHDSHADYVIKSLQAGKNVFVEKPLAMTKEQLILIRQTYHNIHSTSGDPRPDPVHLMVGFNRRFSPFVQEVKKIFSENRPKALQFRINAGSVPKDHWTNDPQTGGGRIIGEACHFIDLAMYLAGSKITSVYASSKEDPDHLNDTVAVNLSFENGSTASISYFSNGNKKLQKEYLEIFCDGTVAIIDDFRKLTIYGKNNRVIKGKQDKGHKAELALFLHAIRDGKTTPINFEELYMSTLATFCVLDSIAEKRAITLQDLSGFAI
jgi:polar amino acid transport system substrate-binding protein